MNFIEFLGSLKDPQLCKEYKNKLKNKYTAYLESERLERQQFIYEKDISDEGFLDRYSDNWNYEWFFVGNDIETFYTNLGLDFGHLASTKKVLWNGEFEYCYKDYTIHDMWSQLEKSENDERFCFGIYEFSKILRNNEKQDILRNGLQILLDEMLIFKTEELVPSEKVLSQYLEQNNGFICMFGHIRIDIKNDRLGQGGNGIVYAGKLGSSDIAVKFLINYTSKKLERFKAEYININMVKSNLVNTVDYIHYEVLKVGSLEIPFIIMKKYDGCLKKFKNGITELKWEDVKRIYFSLCKALKTLEENKIIHRDLKPENILIDESSEFIISDFGIAHFESDESPIKNITKKGDRLANFEFAAPEQVGGKEISFATDIYAFGQILYWFVFGEVNRGTGGNNLERLFENEREAIILNQIVYKCLANNPLDRFQNIEEIEDCYTSLYNKERNVDVYEDMHKFSDIVRSVLPECYRHAYCFENKTDISNLIKKLSENKFNRPLEYNTGSANNQIKSFYEIENGNFILETREIIVNRIWGLFEDSCYNDILILEIENPKLYLLDGEEYSAVAIINNELTVPYNKIASGYFRFPNGAVESIVNMDIEERFIYDETEKYIVIGTYHQCSIIPENDGYIDDLQKYPNLNEQIILQLKKNISKNKTYEVKLGL
ncbi:serine/threonine protein kinase [Desulfosporosinus acidiphilus SJ4]|uniref:Serine/threonine protein kinase n=1 Tax=Desulfosporosinus acidiphilus (strain DSM 22704 / JCM 16185 / SJ4) TaxID=646529 RepID=I4D3V7_DESAJ|nr:serine/threonine-protein kinase [Desulfosporosinus acidiphilus]AFM40481.1 serine/threonine protein kinase [Desulfosporosinus acidiphilus SJ4]